MLAAARPALAKLIEDRGVARLLAALDVADEETGIVGGAVRNALMGLPVTEIDFATTALPEEVTRLAQSAGFKPVPTGIAHGTVTVVVESRPFEVTTLREDVATDGRHAVVRFGRSFALDAARRDFTINGLSLDRHGKVHDEVEGLADIASRRVRFIGDAERRIREDYLRILRFFRFHASYASGAPDATGFAAAIAQREGLRQLSAERVRNELFKLLAAPGAAATVAEMLAGGFWPVLIGGVPHVGRLARFIAAVGADPEIGANVPRLAALALLTREDAERLRIGLRLSKAQANALARTAEGLERLHGLLPRRGEPGFAAQFVRLALDLGAADVAVALSIEARDAAAPEVAELRRLAARIPPFPVTGRDLLKRGVAAGPEMGRILSLVRDAWIAASSPVDKPSLAAILDQVLGARN